MAWHDTIDRPELQQYDSIPNQLHLQITIVSVPPPPAILLCSGGLFSDELYYFPIPTTRPGTLVMPTNRNKQ